MREGLIALLAITLRLGAIVASPESFWANPSSDPDAYAAIARHVRSGHYSIDGNSPTAYRPPGFVIALLPGVTDEGIWAPGLAVMHALAGGATALLAVRLARQVAGSPGDWLAGLVVAIDPILIHQSTLVMSETLFSFLFMSALVLSFGTDFRFWLIAAGVFWGWAGLTRPIAWAVWGTLIAIWLIQRRFKPAGWVMLSALGTALPWTIRNGVVLGAPILTSTHGGYTLWLGQNPAFYREVVATGQVVWPSDHFEAWTNENAKRTKGMNEVERDRAFGNWAIQWMRDHPQEAIDSFRHHLSRLWAIEPASGPTWGRRWVSVYYGLLFIFAGAGLLARLGRLAVTKTKLSGQELLLFAIPLLFSIVHAMYWSDMRMRGPLAPVLGVFAVWGYRVWFRR